MELLLSLILQILLTLIYVYRRLISPIIGANCRFTPTCSLYAYLALSKFGIMKGMWLSLKRIFKCHPFVNLNKKN